MSFRQITISGSSQLRGMVDSLGPLLKELTTAMATGMGNLNGLLPPAGGGIAGKAGDVAGGDGGAGNTGGAREVMGKALRSNVRILTITPYNSGMRKGDRSYLTPENALQKLVSVFDQAHYQTYSPMNAYDTGAGASAISGNGLGNGSGNGSGDNSGDEIGVIILTFLAESEERLAESLVRFNAQFPLEELERKAKALSTLERDKFVIPEAPSYPAWGETSPANEKTGQSFNKTLGGLVGSHEGQTTNPSLARLSAFAQKQAGKIADKLKSMQDMADSMQGEDSAWQGVYFAGSFVETRRFIKDLVPPPDATSNAAYKISALVCFTGKPDHLTFYKESFGL